jgi:hypothetical protein
MATRAEAGWVGDARIGTLCAAIGALVVAAAAGTSTSLVKEELGFVGDLY